MTPATPNSSAASAMPSLIVQRQIEARITAALVEDLTPRFGLDQVLAIVKKTIVRLARRHGQELIKTAGGNTLQDFYRMLSFWTQDQALEIEMLENNDRVLCFNVTRCRYAEFYREQGMTQLGGILSCSRDFALIEGFNPNISLVRTQTILEGATHCDFRYECRKTSASPDRER